MLESSLFFFVKQKTAYEMRISDWSSDVCSSDLSRRLGDDAAQGPAFGGRLAGDAARDRTDGAFGPGRARGSADRRAPRARRDGQRIGRTAATRRSCRVRPACRGRRYDTEPDQRACPVHRQIPVESQPARSEEHTSELQSLMRISYAVF